RSVGARTLDDTLALVGSALAAVATTWLIFYAWFGWRGQLGFIVLSFLLLLAFYAGVTALTQPKVIVVDRVIGSIVFAAATIVAVALASTLIYVVFKGIEALRHWNFYTHDMSGVRPTDPLTKGGIFHALVGSVLMVGIAVIVALPLGLGTAVYMTEVG